MLVTLAAGATRPKEASMIVSIQRLLPSIAILLWVGMLSGCQTRDADQTPTADFPPPITSWPLADDPTPHWRISSEFSGKIGEGPTTRTFRALLTLERSGDQLHFIALSPLGIPLFTATLHADGKLNVEQQVPTSFEPARVLAELQFCLWPSSLLRTAYLPPWSMQEDESTRTLYRRGEMVATARWMEDVNELAVRDKANRAVVLQQRIQNYEISIRPLPQSGAK
jgi:Protein of unknown function (DUF3261)